MTKHDTEHHSCVTSGCTSMDRDTAITLAASAVAAKMEGGTSFDSRFRPKQARSNHPRNVAAREEDATRVAWCAEDPMR